MLRGKGRQVKFPRVSQGQGKDFGFYVKSSSNLPQHSKQRIKKKDDRLL